MNLQKGSTLIHMAGINKQESSRVNQNSCLCRSFATLDYTTLLESYYIITVLLVINIQNHEEMIGEWNVWSNF